MDTSKPFEPVTIQAMKESIGTTVFLWTSLERELENQIAGLAPHVASTAHTIKQKCERWAKLQEDVILRRVKHKLLVDEVCRRLHALLALRNCLTHGVRGWTADPFGRDGDAHFVTQLNGVDRKIAFAEVERSFSVLLHLASAIGILSFAASESDDGKAAGAYEGILLNHMPKFD